MNEQISFKKDGCLAVIDFKKCDEIKEEIIQLKKQLQELEEEKSILLFPAVSQSGITETNIFLVIQMQTTPLRHAVTQMYRIIRQHQLQVLCQVPPLMKVFLLSAHLKNLSPEFPASQYPLFPHLKVFMRMLMIL